jgi:hypothetical protein
MKFLKGFGLAILGFFLSLSLITFGFVLTINQTALNADFVVSEIDSFDSSLLVEEILVTEPTEEEFSQEFIATVVDTVDSLEVTVKEQVAVAVHLTYDYLLRKRESPDLADTLSNTFMNSEFVASLLDEVDIPTLAEEIYTEQIATEIPSEMEYLVDYLDDVIAELEPWLKEQAIAAADPFFAYLLGESQSLNVVIPLETAIETLHDAMEEAFWESPPPKYAGLTQSELQQHFDEFFAEFIEILPSTPEGEHQFELDETVVGADIPAQVADALAEAEDGLEQARQYVGYFQIGFKALIGFILLLILGIVLIYREVKGSTRQIGISSLVCGIFILAGFFIANSIASSQLAKQDIPSYLTEWLPQLIKNALTPLEIYGIGLMAAGAILIIVSFVYRRRKEYSYY